MREEMFTAPSSPYLLFLLDRQCVCVQSKLSCARLYLSPTPISFPGPPSPSSNDVVRCFFLLL